MPAIIRSRLPARQITCVLPGREHWDAVRGHLDNLKIPYSVDHRLVRGLDYYSRTVFEIQPPEEGSQSTIIGGGRYDGLIQELGGRPTPGVGFGSGMERIIVNLKRQKVRVRGGPVRPTVIVTQGDGARKLGVKIATALWGQSRRAVQVLVAPGNRSLKSQLRYASSLDARHTLILGDEELRRGVIGVRDMDKGRQVEKPTLTVVEEFGGKEAALRLGELLL